MTYQFGMTSEENDVIFRHLR